jgi:hypothetical protein
VFDQPSYNSESTHPTQYSFKSMQYEYKYNNTGNESPVQLGDVSHWDTADPRHSQCTYASTLSSEDEDDLTEFSIEETRDIEYEHNRLAPAALASTPRDFNQYFPTRDRLLIQHDDSTLDGNMNLRVDTLWVAPNGRKRPMTLFHLRMHDLKSRDFSLRRYCRDSGREVCNSARHYQQQRTPVRPGLQRSLSSAFATLRRKKLDLPSKLQRRSSVHTSTREEDDASLSESEGPTHLARYPTNIIKLEFSNYAHIKVTRCGGSTPTSWKFDYWGNSYTWKKQVDEHGNKAYRLFRTGNDFPCIHIVQDVLTTLEAEAESAKGGWVPPCSMWMTDESILMAPDVAE